ncbi:hypothetical protein [Lacipirellula parvula]|uniref:Uncharacterized protein n=1 Tax=Lacipirellula parvula TaxID=2650471 RepID=A0A5K7XF96_9BACT|nr:hypothetical protein [Lacipirellula parvula]BBO35544.1 hypothetical protein PLANPX_5156 [Lacipirellula parvula]
MSKEQAAAALAASEALLAQGLAAYCRAVIQTRDYDLIERLKKRFKDPATVTKMEDLLNES